MQGGGFYNRHSAVQAANLTSALPLLQEAAQTVALGDGAVVVADYGASQGRNSMLPMRTAIGALRARVGVETPIDIVHVDLPGNDFAALFTLIVEDPSSYLAGEKLVFPMAIGRSHFGPVLPPGRVHLGWSSNALHWLSRTPAHAPDHGWAVFSRVAEVRDAVDRQLELDWRAFLQARAAELRPGGRLICQFMGRGPQSHGFEWMADLFWRAVTEVAGEMGLSDGELLRMTCPSAGRSLAQIEAPFEAGVFEGLALREAALVEAPDPFWETYCARGDAAQLGRSWAMMMRAANGPSFVAGLDAGRDAGAFLDAVTDRLAGLVAADPRRSQSHMAVVAVEKIAPG